MKYYTVLMIAPGVALACCGPSHQPQEPAKNAAAPVIPAPSAPPAVSNSAPAARQRATPTIDPRSSEAAVALVRGLVELLNQHKFNEAYMLLGAGAPPRSTFDSDFSRTSDLRVTIGTPGDQEGAAGSIYLSVPLTVSGTSDGKRSTRAASAILRRVNDVPGSTDAERHWHIERIDWGNAP